MWHCFVVCCCFFERWSFVGAVGVFSCCLFVVFRCCLLFLLLLWRFCLLYVGCFLLTASQLRQSLFVCLFFFVFFYIGLALFRCLFLVFLAASELSRSFVRFFVVVHLLFFAVVGCYFFCFCVFWLSVCCCFWQRRSFVGASSEVCLVVYWLFFVGVVFFIDLTSLCCLFIVFLAAPELRRSFV